MVTPVPFLCRLLISLFARTQSRLTLAAAAFLCLALPSAKATYGLWGDNGYATLYVEVYADQDATYPVGTSISMYIDNQTPWGQEWHYFGWYYRTWMGSRGDGATVTDSPWFMGYGITGTSGQIYGNMTLRFDQPGYYNIAFNNNIQPQYYECHVMSLNVNIYNPNSAPTGAWNALPPATIYKGDYYWVRASGHDDDGNLAGVYVEYSVNGGGWQALAYDGLSGYDGVSNPNGITFGAPGTTYQFRYYIYDNQGAATGWVYSGTYSVTNRPPRVTTSATPTSIYLGQTATISATATDADANLAFHGILFSYDWGANWLRSPSTDHSTGWGNHPTSSDAISASYSSGSVSGSTSTRSITVRPSSVPGTGVLYAHSNTNDGIVWASSDSNNWTNNCVGYASVTVNKATPTGSFATSVKTPQAGANYTVQAGDLNATFANPYAPGSVAAPGGAISYTIAPSSPNGTAGSSVIAGSAVLSGGLTYVIRATVAADGNYVTNYVDSTWTISKGTQSTPSVTSAAASTYGNAYTATATGGNGTGAYVWTRVGGTAPGGAINSSTGVVTANGAGTVILNVYRAADTNWAQSPASANFTLTIGARSLTVTLAGSKVYDGTTGWGGTLNTTGYSGTAPGDTVSGYATTSATVGTYNAATGIIVRNASSVDVTSSYSISFAGSYTITQATQSAVSVSSANSFPYGNAYTATASGGNGTGAYTFALGAGSTAPGGGVNASTGAVTANGTGTVVIRAQRAADTNYSVSGWSADYTVSVGQRPLTITLGGSKQYDGTTTPTGATGTITAGSLAPGDSIGHSFANTSSATPNSYSGLTTSTLTNASAPNSRTPYYSITYAGSFIIGQSTQTINFAALPDRVYGDAPFSVSATASSGLPVTFSIVSGPATIVGNTVTITGAGTITVRAAQAGNTNYSAAPNVDRTCNVAQAPQTITLSPASQTVYRTQTVSFTAAGGQNAYNWGGTAGASGSGTTKNVTFNTLGTFTVTAQNVAAGNYGASNVATSTITVNQAYTLTLGADAGGVVSGAGLYASAATANPVATPNAGYVFAGWYGGDSASMTNAYDPSGSIVMTSDKSLTARFVSIASVPVLGAIDFGGAAVPASVSGNKKSIRDAIMSNVGNSALELRSMTIVSGAADFSVPATGGMISGGANITAAVTFSPSGTALTTRSGRLVVVTTDATYPLLAYDLTGTANNGSVPPTMNLSVTALATIFQGDTITLNVTASVSSGNVSYMSWNLVTPSTTTAPAMVNGPQSSLSAAIPYLVNDVGLYTFQVSATNDAGQTVSGNLTFTAIKGQFTRVLNARAEPSGGLNIWFTPSSTSSQSVDVWKTR